MISSQPSGILLWLGIKELANHFLCSICLLPTIVSRVPLNPITRDQWWPLVAHALCLELEFGLSCWRWGDASTYVVNLKKKKKKVKICEITLSQYLITSQRTFIRVFPIPWCLYWVDCLEGAISDLSSATEALGLEASLGSISSISLGSETSTISLSPSSSSFFLSSSHSTMASRVGKYSGLLDAIWTFFSAWVPWDQLPGWVRLRDRSSVGGLFCSDWSLRSFVWWSSPFLLPL